MTADIWASEARSDRWWQGQEPQQVIGIIEALVQGNIDPSSASKQITSLYEPLVKADPSSVTVIWGILFRAVRGVGQDEAIARKLVDFVLRIQQSDDVLDDSGQQVKFGSHAVWRDLPEFSYSFGLYCIFIEHADEYKGDWLDQAPGLLSATTFGALLMGASDPKRMSFLASSSIIDGIETVYSEPLTERAAMWIPAAVTWIRLAGKSLYKLCQDREPRSATLGIAETGRNWLWTGGVGFSPERWDFWKLRLGELACQEGLDEHLQTLAREARTKMLETEG